MQTRAAAALRRRFWITLITLALGAATGVAASILEKPVYASTTQLLVDTRITANGDFDTNLQNTQLLGQYFMAKLTSRSVLASVASDLGPGFAAEEIATHLSVQVLKGTDLLAVTAYDGDPDRAARLANLVARDGIAYNRKEADQRFASRRTDLDQQLAQLDAQIRDEQTALSRLQVGTGPNADATLAGAISAHEARLNLLQVQYSDLYHHRQTIAVEQDLLAGALAISEPAVVPSHPVRPVPPLYVGGGAIFGLLLGVLLILLVDRLDPRVHSPQALADATGTRVAVTVDHGAWPPRGRLAAAYAVAWASVLAENPQTRTLMLVGAAEGDHPARPASAIAEAAGRSNRAVVLFGTEGAVVVNEAKEAAEAVKADAVVDGSEGLLALPLNHPYRDPRESSPKPDYDLVVTSVPAPAEHPVAMTLAPSTDAAIVVATAGRTRLDEARRTAESLRMAGVPLVASILVKPAPEEQAEDEGRRTA